MYPPRSPRPITLIATTALVVAAIASNVLWLWIVTIIWLCLVLFALLMYVSGKI